MDSFIDIMTSGFLIGVLISAPMGPVGMLCIQRTLNKGRVAGLTTGIGASVSDLIYCLLTGFGLSFIEEFINRHQIVLQILGSLVLIGFGIYLFRKNPARQLKTPDDAPNNVWGDIISGFFFTFSNPLILFFIVGLFARFNFLLPEFKYYHYVAGYASIIGGALVWWWVITFFVNKVRAHFNVRSLWLINRIIALILMAMAGVGLFMGVKSYILTLHGA